MTFGFFFPLLYRLTAPNPESHLRHLNIHTLISLLPVRLPAGCGPSPSSAQKCEHHIPLNPNLLSPIQLSHAPDKQAFQSCQFHSRRFLPLMFRTQFHGFVSSIYKSGISPPTPPKLSAMVTCTLVYHLAANFLSIVMIFLF